MKFDGSGNILVTNSANGGTYGESVLKLTPSGSDWTVSAFVSYALGTVQPFDVAFDLAGNVFVSSAVGSNPPTILKYDSAGNLDGTFSLSGVTGATFMSGLTYENGKLYAVAFGSYKIWEVNPETGAATDFITSGLLPDYRSTFITTSPIPEPSVVGLLILGGFGGLVFLTRRGLRPIEELPQRGTKMHKIFRVF